MDEKDRPIDELREEIAKLGARIAELSARSTNAAAEFWIESGKEARGDAFSLIDAPGVAEAFGAFAVELAKDPKAYLEAQAKLHRRQLELTKIALERLDGESPRAVAEPGPGDRRFRDKAWDDDAGADYLKQAYLLAGEFLEDVMRAAPHVEPNVKRKVSFFTRQFLSAASPANFAATNPAVMRAARESGGASVLRGLENLVEDLERGGGRLDIRRSRGDAFEVGRNLAVTPGAVIFENALIQLIHYRPRVARLRKRPLLIVPPWINKFYVLDLQPENSFVAWALEQGIDVYLISWVNAGVEHADFGLDAYLEWGPLAALDAIEADCGEARIDVLGFCIGGILTLILLGWLAAKRDDRIASATLLAAMVDFSDVGETRVFVDERQVERIEKHVAREGYLDGRHMADMFAMMRENDLIWSFVVNNYLMGREPLPFDLLHWNGDSTRMPARMLVEYLRALYIENRLSAPNRLEVAGERIDLRKVNAPIYALAAKEDHIAPWRACWPIVEFARDVVFTLAGSGHIAGVINPPSREKYGYVVSETPHAGAEALLGRSAHRGSWWPHWRAWLFERDGAMIDAAPRAEGRLAAIEPAPGRYVLG